MPHNGFTNFRTSKAEWCLPPMAWYTAGANTQREYRASLGQMASRRSTAREFAISPSAQTHKELQSGAMLSTAALSPTLLSLASLATQLLSVPTHPFVCCPGQKLCKSLAKLVLLPALPRESADHGHWIDKPQVEASDEMGVVRTHLSSL